MGLAEKMVDIAGRTAVYGAKESDVFAMVRAIMYMNTQLNIMANIFTDCEDLRDHKNTVQQQALEFFKNDT